MCPIRVKLRMFLGEWQVVVMGWLMLLAGMQRPAEMMLEILALPRITSGLFLSELSELLKLLSAELLGVVSSWRLESDRRVRGQMLMRRAQMR
jgi:hypothetical protein